MMRDLRVSLVGGGKMGFAMLAGWLDAGVLPTNVAVHDPYPSDEIRASGVLINPEGFQPDCIILAVKPQLMDAVLAGEFADDAMVMSVAAGVSIATFEKRFGADRAIVRAMPNTPAAVGAGITAIVGNTSASVANMQLAEALLKAVGDVVVLDEEAQMDAVTGLSGSGPAYVFHMIEVMTAAGVAQGLPEDMAAKLALATVAGAGKLAVQGADDPKTLRENVTSPGGTTAAGLNVLMNVDDGLPPLIARTVAAAAERSRELGKN